MEEQSKNQEATTKEVKNSKIGRPKGSANARTQDLFAIAERLECNPFEILLLYAKRDHESLGLPEYTYKTVGRGEDAIELEEFTISPELSQKSAKDACEYLFPKRKSIEVSDPGRDDAIKETLETFLKSNT